MKRNLTALMILLGVQLLLWKGIPIISRTAYKDTSKPATVTLIGVIPWIFVTLASHNIVFWNVPQIDGGISGALVFGTVGAIAGAVIGAVIGGIYDLVEQNKQTSNSSNSYSHDSWQSTTTASFAVAVIAGVLGIIIGGVYGTIFSSSRPNDLVGIIGMSIWGIIVGGLGAFIVGGIAGLIIGFISSVVILAILKLVNDWLSLLAAAFGMSVGFGFIGGFFNPATISALVVTGIPLLYEQLYPPIKYHRLITKYRHAEKNLIKP
ncbi:MULTISPECIES: hypothetical protein [Fischerella]|nr:MULTISPECIES: hypothetical protein [Fischerella]